MQKNTKKILKGILQHYSFIKNLKLLKVSNVFKMQIVQTVYKSLNHMLPGIFNNYFQMRSDIHQHNTINGYKLHIPRARKRAWQARAWQADSKNLGKQTLKIRGAEYYNELSSLIITKNTYKFFPRAVQNHIIQSYI